MDHHRIIHSRKHACLQHPDFTAAAVFGAAALLRRRAQENRIGGKLIFPDQLIKNDSRHYAGGCNQIMSAGVAVGQRIKFGYKSNVQVSSLQLMFPPNSGLKQSLPPLNRKSPPLNCHLKQICRRKFLIRQFGIIKNFMTDFQYL